MTGSRLRRVMHDNRNNHKAEAEVGLHLMGQPSLAGLSQACRLLTTQCTNSWEVASTDWGPKSSNRKVLAPLMRTATQHESRTGPLSCRVRENRALERSNVRADCVVWGAAIVLVVLIVAVVIWRYRKLD
jgi:hypothetical protein